MKNINGVYVPDRENHFQIYLNKQNTMVDGVGTYHHDRLMKSLSYVTDFSCAIDIGAHVGLWSMHLVTHFDSVVSFEPDTENLSCLIENTVNKDTTNKIKVHHCALGNGNGTSFLNKDFINTGKNHIVDFMEGVEITMKSLDSFNLNPSYIKIDVEGYELSVLKGAEQTLKICKPVIIMEVGPSSLTDRYDVKETESLEFLQDLGAEVRENIRHDYILSWDD